MKRSNGQTFSDKKKDFVSVNHLEEFTELVDFFDSNDFFGVPVVDNDDTLVGILLRRDVLEEETERVAQQHFKRIKVL
ncbi:MAG: CBS domain-containing protein [Chitinophagales bacterium]